MVKGTKDLRLRMAHRYEYAIKGPMARRVRSLIGPLVRPCRHVAGCVLVPIALGFASAAMATIQFEDVSDTAGTFGSTESWGATVSDFNGDGWTDIFLNNHRQRPALFLNEGNGTFSDITLSVDKSDTWVSRPIADHHGAGWGDFDNDGDSDLWISTGVCCDAQFMVNHGGYFTDEAVAYDVWDDGSGRGVNWFDFSGDGFLDAIANTFGDSKTKQQKPLLNFVNRNWATDLDCGPRTDWVHIADFTLDGIADLVCTPASGTKWYDVAPYAAIGDPFVDLSASFPRFGLAPDSAAGDFDNNLQTDVFVLNGDLRPSGGDITDGAGLRIEALIDIAKNSPDPEGFSVQGGEQVRFTIDSSNYSEYRIFIGGVGGFNPPGRTFTLQSSDPNVQYDGTLNHDPAAGRAFYIAFNTTTNAWEATAYGHSSSVRAYIMVDNLGTTPFSNFVVVGETSADQPKRPSLFINQNGVLVEEGTLRGLTDTVSCSSVGHGDFDNDGDLDVYLVCREAFGNIENILLENDGTGAFTPLPGAGGAEGPVGSAVGDGMGTGESVVVSDFDADGFLDLFVTNGLNLKPGKMGGPNKLFRNLGNANQWLEFDLVATGSSADAIGARVYVTAGGVTQLREQDHGYHRWSQNDKRVHFGLGGNATADSVVVEWPSGEVNEFSDIAAGAVYRITEGAGGPGSGVIEVASPSAVVELPGPQPGDECGEPLFHHDFGSAILVWKDCATNIWHVRAKGGKRRDAKTQYVGMVSGDQPLASVTPFNLSGGDIVDNTLASQVEFDIGVWFDNDRGFDLDPAGQGDLCFDLQTPPGTRVLVGAGRWPIKGPFSLLDFGPCLPRVAVSDMSVDEAAGIATVTIALSEAAGAPVTVDYATSDDTAVSGLDYTGVSAQAVIESGNLETSFDVPITGDSELEGDETFVVTLSNPSGALPGQASATVTILDDDNAVCGEPDYDRGAEQGVFLWRDCDAPGPDQVWHVRVTGGGAASTATYSGTVSATEVLGVAGFSIEGGDTLDSVPGDLLVDYALSVVGPGQDGFQLSVPVTAETCFGVDTLPAGAAVHVGEDRAVVTAPFVLSTREACGSSLSVSDTSVDEAAGIATVTIALSEAAGAPVTVDYATSDDTAVSGLDYTGVSAQAVIESGNLETSFDVPITGDSELEGDETFVVTLSNPSGALLEQASATVTILDDDNAVCGGPDYDRGAEQGVFLWRDCDAPGPDQVWHMRVTGGGAASTVTYAGNVSATEVLGVAGFSIEGSDTLDSVPDDLEVDFVLNLIGRGQDGFQLTVPATAEACFGVDTLPVGATVQVGEARMIVAAPFELGTLQGCAN